MSVPDTFEVGTVFRFRMRFKEDLSQDVPTYTYVALKYNDHEWVLTSIDAGGRRIAFGYLMKMMARAERQGYPVEVATEWAGVNTHD